MDLTKLREEAIAEANANVRMHKLEEFKRAVKGRIYKISENNDEIEQIQEEAADKIAKLKVQNDEIRKEIASLNLDESQDIAV